MVEIKTLKSFSIEEEKTFGLNGFETNYKYEIKKEENNGEVRISLKPRLLDKTFRKEWPHLEEDMAWYNEIIGHGYSLGAYAGDRLVGVVITEMRSWNNTLWIADIMIAEDHRGMHIGSKLIHGLTTLAAANNVRVIALETQSNNMPAINFYKKMGFDIEGLDLSLYTNDDVEKDEIALYMKKKL